MSKDRPAPVSGPAAAAPDLAAPKPTPKPAPPKPAPPPPVPPKPACACAFPHRQETSPDSVLGQGGFDLERREVHAEAHYTEWHLTCRQCKSRYQVIDDQGYWKPLYNWTRLPDQS